MSEAQIPPFMSPWLRFLFSIAVLAAATFLLAVDVPALYKNRAV
jgi:hypothetical protein